MQALVPYAPRHYLFKLASSHETVREDVKGATPHLQCQCRQKSGPIAVAGMERTPSHFQTQSFDDRCYLRQNISVLG